MKRIVLSRKGFDSKFGGKASPIFSNDKIFSIPIPQKEKSPHKYQDINFNGVTCVDAFTEADILKFKADDYCHYDPFLNSKEGLFGQVSGAQKELENGKVSVGDIFLFFGWFKKYFIKGKDLHHIFGWLQIDEIIKGSENIKDFLKTKKLYHPHGFEDTSRYINNTLYVGSKKLKINKKLTSLNGYGYFKQTHPDLILTSNLHTRSMWKLPKEYFKNTNDVNKSVFVNRLNWTDPEKFLVDTNKGPGQEFILDCENYPKLTDWVLKLIKNNY